MFVWQVSELHKHQDTQRLLSSTNQLDGNGDYKVVTARFTTQTLHKVKIDEKLILLIVHCVCCHIAVMSGLFLSANSVRWILPEFPTWNPDLNNCLVALLCVRGCFFFPVLSTTDSSMARNKNHSPLAANEFLSVTVNACHTGNKLSSNSSTQKQQYTEGL